MTTPINFSRRTVILCLLFSSFLSIAWGYWIEYSKHGGNLGDFSAVFYAARTVADHHDPYKQAEFLQVYLHEGGRYPAEPERMHSFLRAIPICVNLPTTLFVIAPFVFLGWNLAHLVWMFLIPMGLLAAAWLIWDLVGARAPGPTLFLLCVVLANCQVLLQLGNGSALSVSLCVAAVWCFTKQRYEWAGILCFSLGLAIKPQEIGFIWLFFLLAGGMFRRRAWQIFAVTLVIVAVSLLWISQVSPHWLQEWRANIAATSVHGDLNDPGPASIGNKAVGMIVSLQSVLSFFWDDPSIYNPATYAVVGILILIWCAVSLRGRLSRDDVWLAIGSMAALSLLPIYHRQYDVKLLLLTIPACAILWEQGGTIRKAAFACTAAGFLLTADIPVATLVVLKKGLQISPDNLTGKFASIMLTRTPTLGLLLIGTFYLWVYLRQARP